MNLQADLILPSERRSPSVVNARLLKRLGLIAGPLLLLAIGARVATATMALNKAVAEAERAWLATEPKKEQALKVLNQGKVNDAVLRELQAWKAVHTSWNARLLDLQASVPPVIQLDTLRLSHKIQRVDGQAARVFTLNLSGRAVGADADKAVQSLQRYLADSEVMGDVMESAEITRYGADPRNKTDRVFQMECAFKPTVFK